MVVRHVIFGGNGFTGHILAQSLEADGYEVVICDVAERPLDDAVKAPTIPINIASALSLQTLGLSSDDIVYNLAARQYHHRLPYFGRQAFFDEVNVLGTSNILQRMLECGCKRMIYFSTDMVYGKPQHVPVRINHPRRPIGEYGTSKKRSEDIVQQYRDRGISITTFRPRLIIGPGRLGVLAKLFKAIEHNLPVPLIGDGSNTYQMISVFDCVNAVRRAVELGVPNDTFNLGSDAPPQVQALLKNLINQKGSKSRVIKTPGGLVKIVLGLLDILGISVLYKEQYAIADVNYVVDISHTKEILGWSPNYSDEDMIIAAYNEYSKLP